MASRSGDSASAFVFSCNCLRSRQSCDPSVIQSMSIMKLNYMEQMERNNKIVPNGRSSVPLQWRSSPECITYMGGGQTDGQQTFCSYLCLSEASCSEKSLACISLSDLERFRSSATFSIWREDRERSCFYWTD